ncbi:glycosyltransferase family 2 protein [Pedobacter sp. MW01-1-1]|uniref:glycosyltransferase family 2 protein n=1 Tax=Pedobacter sp. MW01-1-1 TaxID=3383027 RepID=UPI003FEFA22B
MISIVIPVHNNAKFLERALNSVTDQTANNWECIIVDDHSIDESANIYKKFTQFDKKFKVFINNKKGGNAARNYGVRKSTAVNIMFLDADDELKPDCISERILTIKEKPLSDMYVFSTEISDGLIITGKFNRPIANYQTFLSFFIAHRIPWHTSSVVWNRGFLNRIGCWNENFERLQDIDLNIRALLTKPKIVFGSEIADSIYHKHKLSTTKIEKTLFSACRLIEDHYKRCLDFNLESKSNIILSFTTLIEKILSLYVCEVAEPIVGWENKFLKTLETIKVEGSETAYVRSIFDILKKTTKE